MDTLTFEEYKNELRKTAIYYYSIRAAELMMTYQQSKLDLWTKEHHKIMDMLDDDEFVRTLYNNSNI